jgi:hypothetical protein
MRVREIYSKEAIKETGRERPIEPTNPIKSREFSRYFFQKKERSEPKAWNDE